LVPPQGGRERITAAEPGPVPAPEPEERFRFQRQLNLLAAGLIVLVATVHLLQLFATVLQQLLVAVFLLYLLMPAHYWLVSKRIPSWLSGILIVLGILVGFSALGILIGSSFTDLEAKVPQYQKTLTDLFEKMSAQLPAWLREALESLRQSDSPGFQRGTELLLTALQTLSDFLTQAFVVLIYLLFILAELGGLQERIENAFDRERASQIQEVLGRINASITQYIVVKTLMGLLSGVLTAVVLLFFGVDYAVLWGIIAFLFNYIPYLGSILATILPVVLSLVQYQDLGRSLFILAILLVIQNSIGYLIEPRLAGRRLDLSPLVIIVSLAFWGSIWGIVGMILAVPLVVVVKTVLENTPATRPLARMLANA
jgi:predicted PurR-regulated permease PerM